MRSTYKSYFSFLAIFAILTLSACANPAALFSNSPEAGELLEVPVIVHLKNISKEIPLSPGVYVVHSKKNLFDYGQNNRPEELKNFIDKGDIAELKAYLETFDESVYVFAMPIGLAPNETYAFQVIKAGQYITGLHAVPGEAGVLVDIQTKFEPTEAVYGKHGEDNVLELSVKPRNY